ncbi:MAG: Glycosyl transferase group 1 [candidate division WS6 bacterium GW2011_GWF1_35_23]|uniref:Glycosyl transferase group 1 n=1 Tax=candidate division WS6 bacterium GW2011_GWF1_35_23 TaxID=1619097 RepID=A0A0G0C846_9BACT|nr:MAG: Glycosyl transferase group 1 [candidate division WS6 bacterium GW2011_GWF1_35_23]
MYKLAKLFPKVAIVADQMTSYGGADAELLSMLKILPHADIFTILFDRKKYPNITNHVYTSFVQNIAKFLPKGFSRHLKIFTPLAYESLNFDEYDLVMTPPRSLWDNELNVRGSKLRWLYRPLSRVLNTRLRIWDWSISRRVDYWTANSKYVAQKIKKTYGKDATVIYPGIVKEDFKKVDVRKKYSLPKKFVLVVSRLYDYKRIDWAINACKETNTNLVIIGEGPDLKYLKKIAKRDKRITFLGFVPDPERNAFFKEAEVLLFCGVEDFGLVPVETMSHGTPVLAYKEGGVLETVKEGVTGEFFRNEKELSNLLKNFNKRRYNEQNIISQAEKFTETKFLNNLEQFLINVSKEEKKKYPRRNS